MSNPSSHFLSIAAANRARAAKFNVISRNVVSSAEGDAITVILGYSCVGKDADEFEFRAFVDGGMLSDGAEDFRSMDFSAALKIAEREARAFLSSDWSLALGTDNVKDYLLEQFPKDAALVEEYVQEAEEQDGDGCWASPTYGNDLGVIRADFLLYCENRN